MNPAFIEFIAKRANLTRIEGQLLLRLVENDDFDYRKSSKFLGVHPSTVRKYVSQISLKLSKTFPNNSSAYLIRRSKKRQSSATNLLAFLVSLSRQYESKHNQRDADNANVLEISIDIPDDTPPEKVKELIKQAALRADMTNRSLSGNGLTVNTIEVTEQAKSLEPSGR